MNIMKKILLSIFIILTVSMSKTIAQSPVLQKDTVLMVYGVCEQCKERIESSLKIKGINTATWDIDSKMLDVNYNPAKITIDKILNKIAAAGHDSRQKKANDAVYAALPACCHYREIENMADTSVLSRDSIIPPSGAMVGGSLNDSLLRIPGEVNRQKIKGVVMEVDSKGSYRPLSGASIQWLGTGEGTTTDDNGVFNIRHTGNRLVVSYSGYKPDTLSVFSMNDVKVILATNAQLKEIKVTSSLPANWSTEAFFNKTN